MTNVVTIVGCGALGSHVAQLLRNEAQLRLIDFDRVDQKNALAQFHAKSNVGKLKASALSQSMQFLWGSRAIALPTKLTAQNVDVLLPIHQLMIDCVDNAEARKLIQAHARKHGTPCLHGALAPNGEFGRAIWDERFVIDSEAGMGTATCEGGEHLPMIAITSAYIARAAQIFLRDGKKVGYSVTPAGSIAT